MTLFLLLLVVVCTGRSASAGTSEEEAQPIMLSTPSNLNVIEGDSLVLPCKVKDIGRNVRVWKQLPSNILFSGSIAVSSDPKISLLEDASLQIKQVTPQYAGEYVCQVSRHPLLNVAHRIQVLVPPSVSPDPPEGKVVVRKGESITIHCNPSGIPKPVVTWTYGDEDMESSVLPSGARQVQGSQLHVSSVDVHHAGLYKCSAENDVGLPANATFELTVLYAPELLVKPEWAHGDEGASVEFVCTCKSAPHAQVTWLQGDHEQGHRLHPGDRIKLKSWHPSSTTQKLSVRLQRLTKDDLGPYSCTAKNSVGTSWKTVEISGLAEPVQVRGNESGDNSFLLRWNVKSYSSIIEYQLKIRKHKSGDSWTDVVIPVAEEGMQQSLLYSQSYDVTGLDPGHKYEAVVQAHNDFGWNRPSETFLFSAGSLPPPDIEDPRTEPSLLPLYEAELDVTDPTYLKQDSASPSTAKELSSHITSIIFINICLLCLI